jgi:hypothetical protein
LTTHVRKELKLIGCDEAESRSNSERDGDTVVHEKSADSGKRERQPRASSRQPRRKKVRLVLPVFHEIARLVDRTP